MIINTLVIVFVLAMGYWWAMQGFFSALLHLVLTIAAGSMALALWEPLVYGLLLERFPAYAWTVGLLLPFAVVLILMRLAADRLVRGNVHVHKFVDLIGGGSCGAMAGVLTAGITVIGLGFMPLGPNGLAGYQPYTLDRQGQVMQSNDGGLTLAVDHITEDFYATLSAGALSPSFSDVSLRTHQPALARRAQVTRLRADEHASTVAAPGEVQIEKVFIGQLPLIGISTDIATALPETAMNEAYRIVIVDTLWQSGRGAFDEDDTARIMPAHVQLIAREKQGLTEKIHMHAPIAVLKNRGAAPVPEGAPPGVHRTFELFDNFNDFVFSTGHDLIGWVFLISNEHEPEYLMVRNLRLQLPSRQQIVTQPLEVAGIFPTSERPAAASANRGEVGPPMADQAPDPILVSNELPNAISANFAIGLNHSDQTIISGRATVNRPGKLSAKTRLQWITEPPQRSMVRLALSTDRAKSVLGASRAASASEQAIWLSNPAGRKIPPSAYVWEQNDGVQEIAVDATSPIESARELPIAEMKPGETLYLYFPVNHGEVVHKYHLGNDISQEVNLKVPKP